MERLEEFAKNLEWSDAGIFLCGLFNFSLISENPRGELSFILLQVSCTVALICLVAIKGNDDQGTKLMQLGLVFCSIGSALFNTRLFALGLVSFGVAHIFFNLAFGRRPIKWIVGLCLYVPMAQFVVEFYAEPSISELIYRLVIFIFMTITMLILDFSPGFMTFMTVFCLFSKALDIMLLIILIRGLLMPDNKLQFCPVCWLYEYKEKY